MREIRQLDSSSERLAKDIRQATRKQYSAEETLRIVLEGLRGSSRLHTSSPNPH